MFIKTVLPPVVQRKYIDYKSGLTALTDATSSACVDAGKWRSEEVTMIADRDLRFSPRVTALNDFLKRLWRNPKMNAPLATDSLLSMFKRLRTD